MRTPFILIMILSVLFSLILGQFHPSMLWSLWLQIPIFALGCYDLMQTRHSLLRNYPVIGSARKLAESLRPMVQQYFVESDTDGAPINRIFRSVVYQRAKGEMDTVPYGTKFDIYRVMRYEDVYPNVPGGRFLTGDIPLAYAAEMKMADPQGFGT